MRSLTTLLTLGAMLSLVQSPESRAGAGGDFETEWKTLAGRDGKAAFLAVRRLADRGDEAVTFLATRLEPVEPPAEKAVQQLFLELDDARFAVRQKAMTRLEALGELALPHLEKALGGSPPLEVSRRMQLLVQRIEGTAYTSDQIRVARALQALERIPTKAARNLLESLSRGAAVAQQTRDARAALERLKAAGSK
jgi:hypothetical protein